MLRIDPTAGVVRTPLARDNLTLRVSRDGEREATLVALLRSPRYAALDSIIVYVARQKQADAIATLLRSQLLDAAAYHAGKPAPERAEVQTRFMTGQLRIIVATISFGMGLDKRDVRAVIHLNMPSSLEEVRAQGREVGVEVGWWIVLYYFYFYFYFFYYYYSYYFYFYFNYFIIILLSYYYLLRLFFIFHYFMN